MKTILLIVISTLLFNSQPTTAQCGKKRVSEFYPQKTEREINIPTMVQGGTAKTKIVGNVKQMRPDVTREWWESWFCLYQPNVLFDYWGCEECSESVGFIVLKKDSNSVVLFNYDSVTYAIFDADILASQDDYNHKLFPDVYGSAPPSSPSFKSDAGQSKLRKNKELYFQYLEVKFKSHEIVALTTKNFGLYFR